MAIEFRERVTIKAIDVPVIAASRLEAQLNRHFPCPVFDGSSFTLDSTEWRLRDASESRSIGASVAEVFEEFREHDLNPTGLFRTRRAPSTAGEQGVMIQVHYSVRSGEIHIEVAGSNRMAVDGVTATVQRIKRALERPLDPSEHPTTLSPREKGPLASSTPQSHVEDDATTVRNVKFTSHTVSHGNAPWLKRTWKDHTAQFILTVVAGVLVVAIGLWLGLTPNP